MSMPLTLRVGRWFAIPLLAFTIGCGLAAAPAPAKVPRSFYGVVITSPPTAADFETMGRGKVGVARIQLNWSAVQPRQGTCNATATSSCDWAGVDAMIAGLAAQHVELLPTLYGTPQWASGHGGKYGSRYDPLLSAKGRSGWGDFVSAVAKRYGPNGKFWDENPGVPYEPIKKWQIWNEQNSSNAFRPKPSPSRYLALVKFSAQRIRAVNAGAEIILGGMFGTPGGGGATTETAWGFLDRLYKLHGANGSFDSVALHPYAPNERGVKYQLGKIHKVLRANHSNARIWVTELGWGSDSKHVHKPNVKTPEGQKRNLVKSFDLLKARRRSWNVAGVTWFSFRDPTSPVGQCRFCLSAGLLTKHLKPKPAWRAFVNFTGGTP
jgi:putative glycosyl hydrolase